MLNVSSPVRCAFIRKMPKRRCSEEESMQSIKKQISSNGLTFKIRSIKSQSSEKTLQLLYAGASKLYHNIDENHSKEVQTTNCCFCSTPMPLQSLATCGYCEKSVCSQCTNLCFNCQGNFCGKCSFLTYNDNVSACYSCYK